MEGKFLWNKLGTFFLESENKKESVRRSEADKKEPEEKKEKKEEDKKEKEEQIENEEEDDKKKKKDQEQSVFSFFNWQNKSDGKQFDPKKPKFEFKHIALASVVGFLVVQAILEFYGDKNNISYTVNNIK